MNLLKKIAIGLFAFVVLMIVIGFFLPSKFSIERSMVMKSQPGPIFDQVNILKNWEKWSPWRKMDPQSVMTYNDIPSGKGAAYDWTSPNKRTGSGTMTITDVKENEEILTKLDFKGQGQGESSYHFEKVEGGTKVTWEMHSDIGANPFVKWMMVLSKGMMEKMFDQGLNDIKTIVESMPPAPEMPAIRTELTTVKNGFYLGIRDTASASTIGMKFGKYFGMISEAIAKQKLKPTGPPFSFYYNDSQTNWELDACIPVDKAGKAEGMIKPGEMKAGNAVVAHYFGAYEGTGAGHNAVQEFVKANNKKIIGPPWEVFITDPMTEKDTAKWQTDIFYPVE
jgi:effector-binding domain-containing protein